MPCAGMLRPGVPKMSLPWPNMCSILLLFMDVHEIVTCASRQFPGGVYRLVFRFDNRYVF